MKFIRKMTFRVKLALADFAFACGLLVLLPLIGLRVSGGADTSGGYEANLGSVASASIAAFLKETYGGLENALRTASYLHDRLSAKGNPFKIEGSKLVMATVTGHNTGFAFSLGGGAALPAAGVQTAIRPETTWSQLFQTMGWDTPTLRLAQSDRGAFMDAMTGEQQNVERTGRLVLNQALYRDKTCRLGLVDTVDGTTITLVNTGLTNTVSGDRCKYLMENMYVDFETPGGVSHKAGAQITSIDHANNSFVVDAAGSAAAGDVVILGVYGGAQNSKNAGLTGLESWCGSVSNTVWGIDRSTAANARWRPVRVNADNAAVTQKLMRRLIGTVQQWGADRGTRLADGMLEGAILLLSIPDKDAYGDVLMTTKRTVNEMQLKGGWLALDCEGYPMHADPDAPVGKIRFLNMEDWALGSPSGNIAPSLHSPDGLVLRQVPGYDKWITILISELELGCMNPTRSGELYGLNTAAYGLEAS